MAGNKGSVALTLLERLNAFFEESEGFRDCDGVKWRYGDIIETFNRSNDMKIRFYNGTTIYATAASKNGRAQSLRGFADVKAVFLTEAAHTGVLDDNPIITGITPLTANFTDGDIILESTPQGKRGFFYDMWIDSTKDRKQKFTVGPNNYYSLEYDYTHAVKANIISQQFIDDERRNPRIDFSQEYECNFSTSMSAAFEENEIRGLAEGDTSIDLTSMLEN